MAISGRHTGVDLFTYLLNKFRGDWYAGSKQQLEFHLQRVGGADKFNVSIWPAAMVTMAVQIAEFQTRFGPGVTQADVAALLRTTNFASAINQHVIQRQLREIQGLPAKPESSVPPFNPAAHPPVVGSGTNTQNGNAGGSIPPDATGNTGGADSGTGGDGSGGSSAPPAQPNTLKRDFDRWVEVQIPVYAEANDGRFARELLNWKKRGVSEVDIARANRAWSAERNRIIEAERAAEDRTTPTTPPPATNPPPDTTPTNPPGPDPRDPTTAGLRQPQPTIPPPADTGNGNNTSTDDDDNNVVAGGDQLPTAGSPWPLVAAIAAAVLGGLE